MKEKASPTLELNVKANISESGKKTQVASTEGEEDSFVLPSRRRHPPVQNVRGVIDSRRPPEEEIELMPGRFAAGVMEHGVKKSPAQKNSTTLIGEDSPVEVRPTRSRRAKHKPPIINRQGIFLENTPSFTICCCCIDIR